MSWKTRAALFALIAQFTISPLAFAATATSSRTFQTDLPVSTGLSVDQQLVRCIEVAKQGDVKQAFEMAKQTKQLYRQQRMFDVTYINALMTIVDETDSKCDVKIINEVITVVNDAKRTKIYDGTGDPEVAFHFMKALERLASITAVFSQSVTSKLQIYEGQIAVNLKSNSQYPKNALEALAAPMVDMAKGYAFRKEQDKTFAALNTAVSVGYGEFESLAEEEWLTAIADDSALETLNEQLKKSYAVAVKTWSQTVVSQFRPMAFNFDVPSIESGRIRNADLKGKVVVMDLWATWCPPCRKGIPHYMELQSKFADQGVAVLGVSMDKPDNPNSAIAAVKSFAQKQKFNYPIAMGDQSIEGQLPQKMVLPTTIFFDRNGQVRFIARGYHDYAKIEAITQVLLEEKQSVNSGGNVISNF
ncbi:MAG: TlpA disulfide reductase family protein [Planctomycetota bacterium]